MDFLIILKVLLPIVINRVQLRLYCIVNFIDSCMKQFSEKLIVKIKWFWESLRVLPHTGKSSFDLRSRFRRMIEKNKPFCKLNFVFRSTCRLDNLFRFKNFLEREILSGRIYCYTWSNFKVTYYGKKFRHFFAWASEHMGNSNLTGKHIRNTKTLAISYHLLQCGSPINFDDFYILASNSKNF